jgi:pyruvate/2-oxoacid:ferredoxin oxidoreductase alpha subunit
MVEAVYNAAGLGLPIVMTVANRAIGAPINIWNDHSDSMSQRDCGWIQLFAETNQEAADLHIQAFRLGEELSLPVMVCIDGFILTHAYERVDIPTQAQVDAYLPPFVPRQSPTRATRFPSVPWSDPRLSPRCVTSRTLNKCRRSNLFRETRPSSRKYSVAIQAGWLNLIGTKTRKR